jgi:hypothetical protein
VQALSRRFPNRPLRSGQPTRVEFEYRRNGTRNIFAALDIRTGKVLVEVTKDRKAPRVIAFLNRTFPAAAGRSFWPVDVLMGPECPIPGRRRASRHAAEHQEDGVGVQALA